MSERLEVGEPRLYQRVPCATCGGTGINDTDPAVPRYCANCWAGSGFVYREVTLTLEAVAALALAFPNDERWTLRDRLDDSAQRP